MRIQHNIAALNSHRQLTTNNSSVSKNLEKLSSGYRINRAGDDAAGLAISEKMRAQITGLNTASKNAQDGISLVQTAEGALTEVHSMLNRMTELAGQAANGTYQDDVDRENTMKEMVSLRSEIDRISKGTNYNGIKLLDGSMGGAKITHTSGAAASGGSAATAASFEVDLAGTTVASGKDFAIGGVTVATSADTKGSFTLDVSAIEITTGTNFTIGTDTDKIEVAGSVATDGDADGSLAAIKAAIGVGKDVKLDGVVYKATFDDANKKIVFEAAAAGVGAKAIGDGTAIATEITNGVTPLAKTDIDVIGEGSAGAALNEADTLTQIQTSIAGKEFTIDDQVYTAKMDGSKLTFTAKTAGANTPDATKIAAAITNGGAAAVPANTKIDNIVVGKDLEANTVDPTSASTEVAFSSLPKAGDTIKIGETTYEFVAKDGEAGKTAGSTAVTIGADSAATATNFSTALAGNTAIDEITVENSTVKFETAATATDPTKPVTVEQKAQGLTLQIGDTADDFNQLSVAVQSMSSASLGIGDGDISVETQDKAKAAIEKIKAAINTVSSTRGDLGAIQNRLEHTINNLGVTSENMTAAESRIRDVDMAQEMMAFTKNNILTQASQSMLAQANQLPQGVLQLLQ